MITPHTLTLYVNNLIINTENGVRSGGVGKFAVNFIFYLLFIYEKRQTTHKSSSSLCTARMRKSGQSRERERVSGNVVCFMLQ